MRDYHVRYKLFGLVKDETITKEIKKNRRNDIEITQHTTCTRNVLGLIKYVKSYSTYVWTEDKPNKNNKIKGYK